MQIIRSPLTRTRRLAAAGVLAFLALTTAACSSTINTGTLEREVASQIAAQQQVPASEVSVDCPDAIEVSEGAVTRCTATIAGATADVDVTQLNGEGSVEWLLVVPEEAPAP